MTPHDPYCPDPLFPLVTEAVNRDKAAEMCELSATRILELRALCRIADNLTTLTTLEMNR